jgi:hypothetical protein
MQFNHRWTWMQIKSEVGHHTNQGFQFVMDDCRNEFGLDARNLPRSGGFLKTRSRARTAR